MTTNQQMTDELPEPAEVVTPETTDDTESKYDSPAERMRKELPQKLHRNFVAATDDHALVETAGTKEALTSSTPVEVQKLLSDGLYQETDVFFREWLQNHLAAVTREAKRRLVNEYGEDALYRTVEHTHPDLDRPRTIRLPKKTEDILDAAKALGYHPSIEFILDHDEGKLTTRDNGIGMTTGEAIEVWNEPAVSGSGVDLSSAGNKGIGSLTWVTIAGEQGAMEVTTATNRQQTASGEHVPQRDRDGYKFYSYFGGIVPIPGEVDIDYGTEFQIPIQDGVDPSGFKDSLKQYAEILPTQVSWVEVRDGVRDEDEFDRSTFLGRYPREPAVVVDRPGEFTIALDTASVVDKSDNDTFLLDNPIDRNASFRQSFDTLWNDHIQLHNEQGLIVAGPNRGKLHSQVDELAGEKRDITDETKPMPDVPLPQPVASRDSFKRDEAHERFLKYAEHIATNREVQVVSEFVNNFLGAGSKRAATDYLRSEDSTYSLYTKLVKQHAGYGTAKDAKKLAKWFDKKDVFDFYLGRLPEVPPDCEFYDGSENFSRSARKDYSVHRQMPLVHLLVKLQQEVSYATRDTRGDPNLKENRKTESIGKILGEDGRWPIFVGATINHDRAKVVWNDSNYPDAVLIKVNSYGKWQSEPWDASLVKNVPMTHDTADECDEDWFVPDHINDEHTSSGSSTTTSSGDDGVDLTDPDNFQDRPVDVRCTENAAIDYTTTIGDLMEALDDTTPGENIETVGQPHIVVFPDNTDQNVSDHYDLSEFAGIIKCSAQEAEALLKFEQVYEYPDYEQMLRSREFSVYRPQDGRGWSESIDSLFDREMANRVWVNENSETLVNALYGNTIDIGRGHGHIDPGHPQYSEVRETILDKFTPGLDADQPWVAILWPDDKLTGHLTTAYISLFKEFTHRDYPVEVNYANTRPSYHLNRNSVHNVGKDAEKAFYPAWDNDSDMWNRYRASYKGPKDYEKAIHRALRDAGIDPIEDHDPDTLERVLGHLIGCGGD